VVEDKLIVFVCEGPTCKDRWETSNPRGAIAGELHRRACADGVRLEREICLGHCQHGPNVGALAAPARGDKAAVPPTALSTVRPMVIHRLTVAAAGEAIARHVSTLDRTASGDLAVAANLELA
jgi:hypothetical protein